MAQLFRIVPSAALAFAVTFGLVYIMQYLIENSQSALTEDKSLNFLEFVRVKQEEVVEAKQRKPEKPPEPEQPPPDTPRPQLDPTDATISVNNVAANVDSSAIGQFSGLGLGASDGEYLPIVKVAPIYPRRAAQRGLEGYVIVQYTVTPQGTTKDIVVIESTSSLFDRSAVEAAAKFKYKPRVVNGEPIEVPGVQNKFTFKLES
ncbi:MAG: energy transducer TonB [Pseudomonadota bacterium]